MRYAIIIGINDYERLVNLEFCVKDAQDFERILTRFCNVENDNIRLITSESRRPQSNIWGTFIETVDNLKKVFEPGTDDIFFYFSGHGKEASETTVVLKNTLISISSIIEKLNELNPKTKILIFDSCHSGAGFNDLEKSAHFFSLSGKNAIGYYILSACASNETSKESKEIKNGRFTHYLINIIKDLESYDEYDCLDINSIFKKVDYFFKNNPDFQQSPSQQIKSVGVYPLANIFDTSNAYKRYEIDDITTFEWERFQNTINLYLLTNELVKGELIRLIREYLENVVDSNKGNSTIQAIEITKNKVTLIDDGKYFDLFNPLVEAIEGGGIATAKKFKQLCEDYFKYESFRENNLNYYSFVFNELPSDQICTLHLKWRDVYKLNSNPLNIPEECKDYIIHIEKFTMIMSILRPSIPHLLNEARRNKKIIRLEFHQDDWMKDNALYFIHEFSAKDWIQITTYK